MSGPLLRDWGLSVNKKSKKPCSHRAYILMPNFFFSPSDSLFLMSKKKAGKHCTSLCVLSQSVISDSLWPNGPQPARLPCLGNFPSKNTGAGCHFLLQGPSQPRASWVSCTGRQILYHCATWEAPDFSLQMHKQLRPLTIP